jgi:5-methylcytosine-specific restriction enzyme A
MAKLATIKPRLGGLSHRMGATPKDEKERDRQRADTSPFRSWYKTARWQALRRLILQRDLYTCQKTGVLLIGRHPAPNSPVIDHVKPHRGDPELFWDENNLQAVSKAYHDSVKQAEEQSAIKGVWY